MTGKFLKSLREFRNLTQQQVAELLGKTKSNVADLESGEHCTTRILLSWARVLKFNIQITATSNNGTISENLTFDIRPEISSGVDNQVSEKSDGGAVTCGRVGISLPVPVMSRTK